jgi:hypothetical protein
MSVLVTTILIRMAYLSFSISIRFVRSLARLSSSWAAMRRRKRNDLEKKTEGGALRNKEETLDNHHRNDDAPTFLS